MSQLKQKLAIAGTYAAIAFGAAVSPNMAQSLFSNEAGPKNTFTQPSFSKAENFIMTTRQPALALEDAVANPTLIAFDQPRSRFKLEGEDALGQFTFQHDMEKAGTIGELVIAYKNAVSVMREASSLNVKVNGYPVGKFPISSSSEYASHKFLVPANALVDGTNIVEVHAIQRHRVDCSLEATYELWTEIDFMNSGFLTEDEFTFSDLKSLKMIGRSENGLTDLRLVLPKNSGIGDLNAALPLVQTLSLALGRDDIAVTVSDRSGIGPGIDVYLAAMDRPDQNYPIALKAKHGLSVVQTQDARRVAVVLKAPSIGQATAQLLAGIRGELKPLLDEAINRENHLEIKADAGGVYTLGEAGYTARSFSGRLFRTNFDLVMPADFYPAEYATVDLGLHAATSPGLNPQSQLLVRVNGQIVTSLPMRDTDGEVFEDRRIELPMRAFRPGRNQIEILAELEKASDEACVYSERDETAPRFILLENTEIRIPQLARISRLPDLSVFAGTAYPYRNDERLNIYVVHADSRTLSAAMTMMTKMSIASGAPLNAQVILGRPDNSDRENKLVIAPRRAFVQSGPNVTDEHQQMSHRIKFHDADWLPDLITTASVDSIGLPKVTQATPEDLLQAFRHKTQKTAIELSTSAVIKQKFDELSHRFQSWLKYEPALDKSVTGDVDSRKANLVQTLDDKNNSVVTWLAADTPEDVVRASLVLAEPDTWSRVKGADVTVDLRSKQISAQLPSSYQVHAFTNKSPSNLRRLAAAWFSDNFIVYIILIVGFFAFFAVWLGRSIPKAGVRTDQE
ncbi:MAG: cellulose biosynthesis cyclic di-GMP-binding regulatory protein BcsB [Rhizobiaceae bacterium]|nr:cellulose biosynthesis cyclic di-GMP-binding regulatory protein BcsB [Rhizobiaceae bacterium]